MIFPPHCKFLDIFFKLISNTIYKCIPFIIFLFALLATKQTKSFQNTASCSRWWWFNFRSSHTRNKFLLWRFTFNLNVSRLRQSTETAVTTNVKATFSVNRTWKFKITVFENISEFQNIWKVIFHETMWYALCFHLFRNQVSNGVLKFNKPNLKIT